MNREQKIFMGVFYGMLALTLIAGLVLKKTGVLPARESIINDVGHWIAYAAGLACLATVVTISVLISQRNGNGNNGPTLSET